VIGLHVDKGRDVDGVDAAREGGGEAIGDDPCHEACHNAGVHRREARLARVRARVTARVRARVRASVRARVRARARARVRVAKRPRRVRLVVVEPVVAAQRAQARGRPAHE
jgi:hypothetical protein